MKTLLITGASSGIGRATDVIVRIVQRGTRAGYFPTLFAAVIRSLGLLPARAQVALCRRLAQRAEVLS